MTAVWEDPYYSQPDKSKLLIALAIADFAGDEGMAWPSIETLARKARTSVRGAQECCRELERDGKLTITENGGRFGTNLYRLAAVTGKLFTDQCDLCGTSLQDTSLLRHHKLPRQHGGNDLPENIAWLCGPCHDAMHTGKGELSEAGEALRIGEVRRAQQLTKQYQATPATKRRFVAPATDGCSRSQAAAKPAPSCTQSVRNHQEPPIDTKTAHVPVDQLWTTMRGFLGMAGEPFTHLDGETMALFGHAKCTEEELAALVKFYRLPTESRWPQVRSRKQTARNFANEFRQQVGLALQCCGHRKPKPTATPASTAPAKAAASNGEKPDRPVGKNLLREFREQLGNQPASQPQPQQIGRHKRWAAEQHKPTPPPNATTNRTTNA